MLGDQRPMPLQVLSRLLWGFQNLRHLGSQNEITWPTSLATDFAFAIGISAGAAANDAYARTVAANAGSTTGSSICGLIGRLCRWNGGRQFRASPWLWAHFYNEITSNSFKDVRFSFSPGKGHLIALTLQGIGESKEVS